MENPKILYVAQEINPYLPESELSLMCRNLPLAIQEKGYEIRLFMPKYGGINERRNQLHEVIRLSGLNIPIDDADHPLIIKVASIPSARMQVYFIDNEDYFSCKGTVVSPEGVEFPDNDERAVFFVRGVLETVKKLRWSPRIIHCNGWISALVPIYVKTAFKDDAFFKNTKIVTSLYNDSFKNPLSDRFGEKILIEGLDKNSLKSIFGQSVSYSDLMKLSIDYSDAVIQGSADADSEVLAYAKESKLPFLPLQDSDNLTDAYMNFYDKLL